MNFLKVGSLDEDTAGIPPPNMSRRQTLDKQRPSPIMLEDEKSPVAQVQIPLGLIINKNDIHSLNSSQGSGHLRRNSCRVVHVIKKNNEGMPKRTSFSKHAVVQPDRLNSRQKHKRNI